MQSASRPFGFLAHRKTGKGLVQGSVRGAATHLVLRTFVIEPSAGLESGDQGQFIPLESPPQLLSQAI